MENIKIAFISNIVPDRKEYWNDAFTRSGNNVLLGIANGLKIRNIDHDLFSCKPIPSFPRTKKYWISKSKDILELGQVITFLPALNFKIIKHIWWGFSSIVALINWKLNNIGKKCFVLVYNMYTPPLGFLYLCCKILNIRLYGMFYDLGVPSKNLKLGWLTMIGYHVAENFAKSLLRRIDGRIVINENIVSYYAPNSDYLLIDGGINDAVISHLFPLKQNLKTEYTFLCAGMLWENNGTKLILDALQLNRSNNIKVVFAGKGIDVPLIEAAKEKDPRIEYKGMLSMDQLFNEYSNCDVLLNLRIEDEIDFHFPSKLLEYLVTGKYVVSTSIAHAKRDYGDLLDILEDVSPKGLADKMDYIISLSKDELLKKGLNARSFMLEKRTWNARIGEIINYLTK